MTVGGVMHDKPWLTPEQQIEHLERKGVAFKLMNRQEALSYLKALLDQD